jgi:hypothetical protein
MFGLPMPPPTALQLSADHFDIAEVVAPLPDDSVAGAGELTAATPPRLHQTAEMKRLSTPWAVCLTRAEQLAQCRLADGIVLDPACGSGMQLYAYCARLERPGLGIELDSDSALLAAANGKRVWDAHGGDWGAKTQVVFGDGTDAAAALAAAGLPDRPVAVLHVDPARPQDAQRHSLDEMQPPLDELVGSWADHLAEGPAGPAMVIDLSPRLSNAQREEVGEILGARWRDSPITWEWLSIGRGRIDRLTVWFGGAADPRSPARMLRLLPDGSVVRFAGEPTTEKADHTTSPKSGQWLTIVDSALLSSGLQNQWLRKAISHRSESRWLRIDGRRPLLLTDTALRMDDPSVAAFVSTTGEIQAQTKLPPNEAGIESILVSARSAYLARLTLRCTIAPGLQPILQQALDKGLKIHPRGKQGFLINAETLDGEGWFVCTEP